MRDPVHKICSPFRNERMKLHRNRNKVENPTKYRTYLDSEKKLIFFFVRSSERWMDVAANCGPWSTF